jgi:hypothetical protein
VKKNIPNFLKWDFFLYNYNYERIIFKMKVFLKRLAHVKKRQIAKKAIRFGAAAWAFKFGAMNSYPPPLPVDSGQYTQRLEAQYSYQKTATVDDDDEQSLTESQSVNSIRFKTGSGAVINIRNQQSQKNGEEINVSSVQPSEALKSALLVRSGDLAKSGPGSRAKADARRHAKTGSSSIFVNSFVPQSTYCHYHENAPLSCKTRVKLSDNQFQPKDDGSEMYDQNGNSKFDPKDYKGGPPPFENFDYDNSNHTRKNVYFSNERRMNHSYDGHAEKCFDMTENRNKPNQQRFQDKIENYIQSPETERIDGSYRYETPAYHYKKPGEDLIITVNATNNEYISVRNATDFQLEKVEIDGNLGYDSRPSMSVTLRLRGPKQ